MTRSGPSSVGDAAAAVASTRLDLRMDSAMCLGLFLAAPPRWVLIAH